MKTYVPGPWNSQQVTWRISANLNQHPNLVHQHVIFEGGIIFGGHTFGIHRGESGSPWH